MSNHETEGKMPSEAAAALMDKLDLDNKEKVLTRFRTVRDGGRSYLEATYDLPMSLPLRGNAYAGPVADYLAELNHNIDSVVGFDHTPEGITISVRYGDEVREVFLDQHERVVTSIA